MVVSPSEDPGIFPAGSYIIILRFSLVVGAVIGWKGASQLWEVGNTVSNATSLILMLVTCLVSFLLLVVSALRRPPAGSVLLIPIVLMLVFLDYSQTHSVNQFTNGTLVTTDVLIYDDYAARLIIAGKNPYLYDLRPGHEVFQANLEYCTPLRDGEIASRLVYPALAPLLFVPFQLLGLSTQAVFPLFFLLTAAVLFWASPEGFRPLVLLPLFAEQRYLQYCFGGVSDIVWTFFLLLVIVSWKHPFRRGLWYGLACAYKQHPWLLAPFLLIRIWHETEGSNTEKLKQILIFSGVSAGTFIAVNAPFIINDPPVWLASVFQPLTSPMIAFGQGLTALGVTGVLMLPKSALTLLMLSALGTLLFVYNRHFRQVRVLLWIAPGIAMWFGNRSLSSYWYFFVLPLLLEMVRSRISTSPVEKAEKVQIPRSTATVVGAFLVLLISVLLWGYSRTPPLEVSIRPPLVTDGQWVHQMTLEVVNHCSTPVTPRVAVQSWTNQPFFWVIESGPEVLLPGKKGFYVVKADAPFQRFLVRRGAGVIVSDAHDGNIRGMARIGPDPTQAYPAVISNGLFDFWTSPQSKPAGWEFETSPPGHGSLEYVRLDEDQGRLRFSIPKSQDGDYGWARLKTTLLFPDDPVIFSVHVPEKANVGPDGDLLYGVELQGFEETVTVLFGRKEGRVDGLKDRLLWGVPAPREEWAEITLNIRRIFQDLGVDTISLRPRDRVFKGVDFPSAPLTLSLFMAVRNQENEVSGLFGPVRASRLRPDPAVVFRRTMTSPERWLLWKAHGSFQFRNYEIAAENFRKAAEFPELATVANDWLEESLSRVRRIKLITERGTSSSFSPEE